MAQTETKHRTKLTTAFVRGNPEPGKYFDAKGTGLFLLVRPTGGKFWLQRLTVGGKRREIGLGSPPLVTLAEAREQALDNKRRVRAGGNPLRDKREANAALTFEEAVRKVHALHKPNWRNPKHAAQFLSTLETYTLPHIGQKRVGDVNASDVLTVLTPIWNDKRETARRVKQRMGTVLKWAVAQGWRQDNPVDAITDALPKDRRKQEHRKALPYSKVTGCLEAVRASQAGLSTKLALEFLVLTASRSGEVRNMRWGQMDWNADGGPLWTRPAELMKAKVPHAVPLSARACEVLEQAKALGPDDPDTLVFPGTVRGKALSDATLLKLVRELGYDVHIHGFRTSFKTWAQERTTFPREVSEAALAHTIKDKAEAAYARSELLGKRRALGEAWAAYLAERGADVVRIG